MRITVWPALMLTGTMLLAGACTDPVDLPEAQGAPASGSVSPSSAGSPDSSSDDDPLSGSSPEEAQQVLDTAVDALYASSSVNVVFDRPLTLADMVIPSRLTAVWFPEPDSWTGILRDPGPIDTGDVFTQLLYVDGRQYFRMSLSKDFPTSWMTPLPSADGAETDKPSLFAESLLSMTATRVTEDGRTRTIFGLIPNEVALSRFNLATEIEAADFDDEFYRENTLVTLSVVDGYPRRLEIYGRNVGMPAQGVSEEMMEQIAAGEAVFRYSEGTRTKPPTAPPPGQVDRVADTLGGSNG